jgi:DNA-binding beta-propeller fold protein YncE
VTHGLATEDLGRFPGGGGVYALTTALTRVAPSTSGRAKSKFLSVQFVALAAACLLAVPTAIRADTIYVSNWLSATVERFSSTGADLGVFANTGFYDLPGVAFDSAGSLYVANWDNSGNPFGNNWIQKFTPGGVGSVFATGLNVPQGLVCDSADNLYVANSSSIFKFTPRGVRSTFASSSSPQGLAFDKAGNLYAANWSSSTIRRFSPTGANLGVFASTGLNGPVGVAFDSAGNLYAANRGNNTIMKFTAGGAGALFASTGLNNPRGLAFDSAGNLYAANMDSYTVEKFSPAGVDLGVFANTGLYAPDYIAIQPDVIPEPSTWAILSLGAAALMISRRRKSPAQRQVQAGAPKANSYQYINPSGKTLTYETIQDRRWQQSPISQCCNAYRYVKRERPRGGLHVPAKRRWLRNTGRLHI